MRGDITASELYQDQEFLTRIGLGIYDVEFGSNGNVGFEDVFKFSFVENEEEDPKLYRRKVYNLTGKYYTNELARILWARFHESQALLSEMEGCEISLKEAAQRWLQDHGHEFFKSWALRVTEVPFRMRNQAEPYLGFIDLVALRLAPMWRELLEAGFNLPNILFAMALELPKKNQGSKRERYTRLVARLSGHQIHGQEDMQKRIREIKQLARLLSRQVGHNVGSRAATIEYYRRLNLVAEIESAPVRAAELSMAA
ncbi:MAG: hypothetical protein J0I20_31080 [Chloroflexi bacterium]|nr:hypothetical protein [Chloroflexota bacterium]OJV94150.1 MAG: hypothetical protein BGO39_11835 [Chloroflexi bacterium 54-19]